MKTKNSPLLIASIIVTLNLLVCAESPSLDLSGSTTISPNRPAGWFSSNAESVYLNTSPDYFDLPDDSSRIEWPADLLAFNYSSLTKINKDCRHAPDKCDYGAKRSREIDDLDCSCDKECKSFGNCCIDAAELNKTVQPDGSNDEAQFVERLATFNTFKERYDCKELNASPFRFLLIKSECPAGFGNKLIRDKCEQHGFLESSRVQFDINYQDPYETTPVTSTKSRISYSNIYCALCNEYEHSLVESYAGLIKNKASDLKFWRMNVTCDNFSIKNLTLHQNTSLQDFIARNFSYDSTNDSWGIKYTNKKGAQVQQSCLLRIHMPEDLHFFIKPCKPNLIDRCALEWPTDTLRGRKVEALCAAYQSRVNHQEKKQVKLCADFLVRSHDVNERLFCVRFRSTPMCTVRSAISLTSVSWAVRQTCRSRVSMSRASTGDAPHTWPRSTLCST